MELEKQLRDVFAKEDPGPRFTSDVLQRVSRRSARRKTSSVLAGTLLVVAAAASMLAVQLMKQHPQRPPVAPAAVLMTQAAQPVPTALPTAAAVPEQPSRDPGHSPDEARDARRAFAQIGEIVKFGLVPNSKQIMSSLGLYPEDPRGLLPALNHLMDEYWKMLDESGAALCRRKDVVTIELFTDVMRERSAERDSWQVRKWQDFLASLSMKDTTPPTGEPRRSASRAGNVLADTGKLETFDQQQFANFIEWRDGGCQVPAAPEPSPVEHAAAGGTGSDAAAASTRMSPSELAEERFELLSAIFTQDLINDKPWMEVAFERLEINPEDRDAFLARVKRIVDEQQTIGAKHLQDACARWKDWATPELFAEAKLKQDAERNARRDQAIQELWASLSPAEHRSTERGAMVNELSRRNRNPPFDHRKHYLERFESFREDMPTICKDDSGRQ